MQELSIGQRQFMWKNAALGSSTRTRSQYKATILPELCFLCDESTTEKLSQVKTLKIHERIVYSAERLLDEKLLAKLSQRDLIGTETSYHKTCLVRLYNKVRAIDGEKSKKEKKDAVLEGIAIAEIKN